MIANQLAELIYNVTNDYLTRRMPAEQFAALIRGIHSGIDAAGLRADVDAAYRDLTWQRNQEGAA